MSLSNIQIIQKIQDIKADFYAQNSKNIFFKKSQKQDLSNRIIQEISVDNLIRVSIYKFSQSSIFVDYSIIKIYIDTSIYEQLLDKLINIMLECTATGPNYTYEMHINLDGFTITSAERHKSVIEQFCQRVNNNDVFFNKMTHMYIYNTPSMIETISKLFMYMVHPNIKEKMVKYDKEQSVDKLAEIVKHTVELKNII